MINSEPGARARALGTAVLKALDLSTVVSIGPGPEHCSILAWAPNTVVSWSGTKRPP